MKGEPIIVRLGKVKVKGRLQPNGRIRINRRQMRKLLAAAPKWEIMTHYEFDPQVDGIVYPDKKEWREANVAFISDMLKHDMGWYIYLITEGDMAGVFDIHEISSYYLRPKGAKVVWGNNTGKSYDANVVMENDNYRVTYEGDWTWIYFREKPDEAVRAKLKELGFRFSGRRRAWWCGRHVTTDELKEVLQ